MLEGPAVGQSPSLAWAGSGVTFQDIWEEWGVVHVDPRCPGQGAQGRGLQGSGE